MQYLHDLSIFEYDDESLGRTEIIEPLGRSLLIGLAAFLENIKLLIPGTHNAPWHIMVSDSSYAKIKAGLSNAITSRVKPVISSLLVFI